MQNFLIVNGNALPSSLPEEPFCPIVDVDIILYRYARRSHLSVLMRLPGGYIRKEILANDLQDDRISFALPTYY